MSDTAVEAMRRGAVDFLEKPFLREQFHRVLARVQRVNQMSRNIERLEQEVDDARAQNPELLLDFTSPPMRDDHGSARPRSAKPRLHPALGESGTGKSALARVVHQQSHLADKPFVTVSCPSLSKEFWKANFLATSKARSPERSKTIGAR